MAAGAEAWTPARAYLLNDWLREQWLQSWPAVTSLSPLQEQLLWEQQVEESPLPGTVELHASRAATAHRLLSEWRLPEPRGDGDVQLATAERAFLHWRNGFRRALRDGGWLDSPGVADAALALLAAGKLVGSEPVELCGFDEVTPRLAYLQEQLHRRGVSVGTPVSSRATNSAGSYVASDPDTEARDLARWCRQRLEQNPQCTIGVVVPHLERRRGVLDRELRDELTPGDVLIADPDQRRPLHSLSIGIPFVEQPLVAAAFQILAFEFPADFAELVQVLRSPFVGGGVREAAPRALVELELRRARRVRSTLAQCQEFAAELPALQHLLATLAAPCGDRESTVSATLWCDRFRARLRAAGWPGERTLSSPELQAVERFERLLDEFAGADLLRSSWARETALRKLREAAQRVQFQPLGAEPTVQVMGVLEAGGLSFDHLWIAGMSDEAWPPRGAPHPLLPVAWQRQHQLPHSSPQRVSRYARTVTERLLASGIEVVVSRAAQIDGRETVASPFFAPLPPVALELPASVSRVRQLAAAGAALEDVPIEKPDPLPSGEAVRGGVAVLADQAACPFRAFALHRLRARALEVPDERIDPRERGELLHLALEYFWHDWRDHETLLARAGAERDEAVASAVRRAAAQFLDGRDDLPDVFRQLEVRRTTEIVEAWLRNEEEREPFTIAELEKAVEIEVGGVVLRGRLDRIDRLASGGSVVIDYKTGHSPTDVAWSGARPDQPQLPVYATHMPAAQGSVRGLAFGALSRNQLRFFGSSAAPGVFPRVRGLDTEEAWQEHVSEWRGVLDQLAATFRSGAAVVDPKHVRKSCQRCHLQAMCRISERDPYFIPDEELLREPETGLGADRLGS